MQKPAAPLGIIGDGQLALMLGESAFAQGFDFLALGSDPESSFARAFPHQFVLAPEINFDSLSSFAKRCSVLTLENEFHSADLLQAVQNQTGSAVIPSPKSYRHFENKVAQRSLYDSLSIPSPHWAIGATTPDQILTQLKNDFSFPVVLKASQGGYDGYGVRVVRSEDELSQALIDLRHSTKRPVLIEEKVKIKSELAQGALFDGQGGVILLPLVETVQRNGICELVLSRPRLSEAQHSKVKQEIESHLRKIATSGMDGLYSFEFFLTGDDRVFINEGAPRPHNSQHLSLNASPISQFDLLMKFVHDRMLPIVPSPISSQAGVMLNLLGKSRGTHYELKLPALPAELLAYPKLYQKKESRIGRKMGHLNLVDPTEKLDLVEIGERVLKEYQL